MRVPGAKRALSNVAGMRFDRREISGAFGDVGTDLPLVLGMILVGGLDAWWIFLVFGGFQLVAAVTYGIPIPVQPLKAVAALVIAGQISEPILRGGALGVSFIMAVLVVTGALQGLTRLIPACVVRGIQVGLGAKLLLLSSLRFLPAEGLAGGLLALGCFAVLGILLKHPKLPGAATVLVVGMVYAVVRGGEPSVLVGTPTMPWLGIPSAGDILTGLLVLAVPQIPLSLGNSVLATKQLADDWFPEAGVSVRRIGTTYSVFNIVAGLVGGVPVCHGSGGMAGHYAMGGRTGGSVVVYGLFFLALSAVASIGATDVTFLFPLPVLGVILTVEAGTLMGRSRGFAGRPFELIVALAVAIMANVAPYGFLTAMVSGSLLYASGRFIRERTVITRTDAEV